jgi:hypothetical protein
MTVTVVEFALALWTEHSEDDDKHLKDCQVRACRLPAFLLRHDKFHQYKP